MKNHKLILIGTACALLGTAVAVCANTAAKNIVLPVDEMKLPELKPGQVAVAAPLWKDPESGAWSEMIRFKGKTGRHYHTFDYQLVVVQGTVSHWTEQMPEAAQKRMTVGAYWFQPKGQIHEDTCLAEECIMFMNTLSGGETKSAPAK